MSRATWFPATGQTGQTATWLHCHDRKTQTTPQPPQDDKYHSALTYRVGENG
ncbi:hypothetical protein LZ30DRAFT_738214 [Colletotrichum cereale]|nr:hypothetical protein LZ30DRAFT_738214 [Colletotrichum cereale]